MRSWESGTLPEAVMRRQVVARVRVEISPVGDCRRSVIESCDPWGPTATTTDGLGEKAGSIVGG